MSLNTVLYPGTFRPLHYDHLNIALAAQKKFNFPKVLIIPAAAPANKENLKDLTEFNQRCEMAQMACDELAKNGNPSFSVSRVEGELLTQNKPPIYTIQTLRKLYPNFDTIKEKIPILIGADAFATLPTWKEAQKLAEHLLFIVSKRENIPISRNMVIDGKNIPISVKTFEIPVIGLSSTLIRERVRKGLSLEGLVPQAIKDFIQRKGLYREPDPVKFSGALLLHQVA